MPLGGNAYDISAARDVNEATTPRGHNPRGRGHNPRGRGHNPRGRGHNTR